ncbi:MAG: Rab family GTPase [Promethearchaeota archaeon]|jgi:GTPase SAR1 family protein
MLRQVHIFFKKEHIFVKDYAKAYGTEELNNVVLTIKKYMEMPIPGKILNRKISNFQIFHKGEGNLYFLFVTDLIDSLQYVEKIMINTLNKFQELFLDPIKIKEKNESRDEFLSFLSQIQKELHSKISIIGPSYSGKTTLYDILKKNNEKTIMDFAKSSVLEIDGLDFEIWDFQLRDNFSLLWNKFISGSDLVILLFNLANYNLKILDHFLDMQKLAGNYSKLLLIGNKRELVSDEDIRRIKNEINFENFEEISLNSPEAKSQLLVFIKETLGLKESLPPDFTLLVDEAENFIEEGKNIQALAKYKELIKICNKHKDFEYIKIFQEKIDLIENKIRKQSELRREKEKSLAFEISPRLKFKKPISVKPLPTSIPSIESFTQEREREEKPSPPTESPDKLVSFQKLETKPSELRTIKTSEIPIKPKKPSIPLKPVTEKTTKSKTKMPLEMFPPHDDLKIETKKPKSIDFTQELQRMILNKGSSLSLALCQKLVTELAQSLGRPITIEDVELAAEFFVKQEQIV